MKRIKKLIVLVMATTMLLGTTLSVHAACQHTPITSTSYYTETANCGHSVGCIIKRIVTVNKTTCRMCGIHIATTTSNDAWSHSKPLY